MPIFDFTCKRCDHVFEKLCLSGRGHNAECPSCQSQEVTKNIGAPSIKLSGQGWYKDGYGLNQSEANQQES